MKITARKTVIDSQEVISRIRKLQDFYHVLTKEEKGELKALCALEKVACVAPGWRQGTPLVRDNYFGRFAQDLAYSMYKGSEWPLYCVDWDRAAVNLQHNYTSLAFQGVEYWIRRR